MREWLATCEKAKMSLKDLQQLIMKSKDSCLINMTFHLHLGIFMKYYKHITGYLVFFIIERNIVVADKSK
jgi:hypothetical protein